MDKHLKPASRATADPGGVIDNPWAQLRQFTDARIGLGRAGISLPTHQHLAFQLAHAKAQDAVHLPLDLAALSEALADLDAGDNSRSLPVKGLLQLKSRAADRMTYLQRPDLGRRLDQASHDRLSQAVDVSVDVPGGVAGDARVENLARPYDLAIVVVDGLSALAVQNNAPPFLQAFYQALADDGDDWRLAPLTLVEQGRVAIGDEVGQLLNANAVLVLIGERPGLSSPDSLGLYLTWGPRPGLTDASRNCISNVRPAGLAHGDASHRLIHLLREARQRKLTGVQLKDRTEDAVIEQHGGAKNFLTE